MPLITDTVFMNRISSRLDRCKRKSEYLWNFRCPLCGDSRTHPTKKRGYVYRKKDDLVFHCHNGCGTKMFGNFLKAYDGRLYKEYLIEVFQTDKTTSNTNNTVIPPTNAKDAFKSQDSNPRINLPKITELEENHFAKRFIRDRKIPKSYWDRIYYSSNFWEFINEISPKYETKSYSIINEPRIVIPIYDEKNILVGLQGRALLQSKSKYITIRLDETSDKIYGLDQVDDNYRVYVVEGPIDSMFLSNAVATCDSQLYKVSPRFRTATYIPDNQPNNKGVKDTVREIIRRGLDIFIWPSDLPYKDINDAIKAGYTSSQLMNIIDSHTYNGLRAELEVERWEKGK